MRFITCRRGERETWGIVTEGRAALAPAAGGWPRSLQQVVECGLAEANRLAGRLQAGAGESAPIEELELLAPIPKPRKNIICLGLNYAAHAAESSQAKGQPHAVPEHAVVFTKAVTTVNGPYSDVMLDSTVTTQLDWEAELALVIGRPARKVSEADALDHVFGYTVINDLTARDLQFRHKQFFIGKSGDGFCPMGPWITSADEIADPQDLRIECRVNGAPKQRAFTKELIFSVPRIIHLLSRSMTLEPGDIIATGTPGGVGHAREPQEFLRIGDVVECEVERIGAIRNRIVAP